MFSAANEASAPDTARQTPAQPITQTPAPPPSTQPHPSVAVAVDEESNDNDPFSANLLWEAKDMLASLGADAR